MGYINVSNLFVCLSTFNRQMGGTNEGLDGNPGGHGIHQETVKGKCG